MSVTSTVNTTDVELKIETFQFRSVHFSLDQFSLHQTSSFQCRSDQFKQGVNVLLVGMNPAMAKAIGTKTKRPE